MQLERSGSKTRTRRHGGAPRLDAPVVEEGKVGTAAPERRDATVAARSNRLPEHTTQISAHFGRRPPARAPAARLIEVAYSSPSGANGTHTAMASATRAQARLLTQPAPASHLDDENSEFPGADHRHTVSRHEVDLRWQYRHSFLVPIRQFVTFATVRLLRSSLAPGALS